MEEEMKDFIWSYRNASRTAWVPAADMYEDDRDVMIFVDMAGVDPDQVKISLENRGVVITGERRSPSPSGVMRIHQMEIDAGLFRRRIPLSTPVDFDNIQCTYKNGLLRIVLPKKTKPETIQIPIELD
jgi:HSP20 family protein